MNSLLDFFMGSTPAAPRQGYRRPEAAEEDCWEDESDARQNESERITRPAPISPPSFASAGRPRKNPQRYSTVPPADQEEDPDTLSGSVNIDDLISEYDEPSSRRSLVGQDSSALNCHQQQSGHLKRHQPQYQRGTTESTTSKQRTSPKAQSCASLSNLISSSQSYKTAKDNDETISFYSALHDGFSLDEYEWRTRCGQDFGFLNSSGSHHTSSRNGEREIMLQATNFQVVWRDLSFTIDMPMTPIAGAWNDLKRFFYTSLLLSCTRKNAHTNNVSQQQQNQANLDESSDNLASNNSENFDNHKVRILKNLNGSFKSGQLTAIMGPSGAGKTSLLNILSRRRETGLTGELTVESGDCPDKRKIMISSIPQHDHLAEYLTVRESLIFASRLKFRGANHEENVCRVSNLLGLDDCLDTKTKLISGGQQKRVAIAQELLSRPDILILDEPTSGLDSNTCLKTLSVLKDLVRASAKKIIDPIAIVLTIHQPQQEAFELFDKVCVMANGGIVIYDSSPKDCIQFVERHTGIKLPPHDYNPASFIVDIASGEYGQEPIRRLARQVRLDFEKQQLGLVGRPESGVEVAQASDEGHDGQQSEQIVTIDRILEDQHRTKNGTIKQEHQGKGSLRLDSRLIKGSEMNSGAFCYKTRVLTERCWLSIVRDPLNMAIRILFHLLLPFGMALILGTEPGQVNACPKYREEYSLLGLVKTDEYISPEAQSQFLLSLENVGVLFITIYSCVSANVAAATLMFALDMNSSLKEHYNGWYSMNSYLFARVLSNIPLDLTMPTGTMALMYVATGQNTGHGDLGDGYRIIITALAVIVSSITGQIMGMIFGAIYMEHVTTALFASQGALLPFVLLSGFVARIKNMSTFVRYLTQISFFRHCLEITFIARYGWNVCGCNPDEIQGKEPRITGVSEKLENFVQFWQNSQRDENSMGTNSGEAANGTGMFDMIAKQISRYNTHGKDIKSCAQVVPYQLDDFGISETDLPYKALAMVSLVLTMFIMLVIVVKFLTTHRTSL